MTKDKHHYAIGFIQTMIVKFKSNRYKKDLPVDDNYWDKLTKKNKTTGTIDLIISTFDQLMRIHCVEYLFEDIIRFDIKKSKLLDFGCGKGDFIFHFTNSFGYILGFDISKEILKLAEKKLKGLSNVSLSNSLDNISEKFDIVISITVMQHILDDGELVKTLTKISELMNKNAYLIALEFFDIESFHIKQPNYIKTRSLEQWQRLFSIAGFELIETRNFYNPYLIKTHSFIQYMEEIKLIKLFYKILKRLKLKPTFLSNLLKRHAEKIIDKEPMPDGFVNVDSFSKFIICKKK